MSLQRLISHFDRLFNVESVLGRPCATVVLLDSSQENTNACCQNQEAIERHDAFIALIASGFFFQLAAATSNCAHCERGNEAERSSNEITREEDRLQLPGMGSSIILAQLIQEERGSNEDPFK